MLKTWRCVICGHTEEGEEPPNPCPVCHADASKFVLVAEVAEENLATGLKSLLQEMRETFVPHAVAAHFPNALLPTLVLFLGLFLLTGAASLETSAFYLLVVCTLAVPATFASGLYDWKKHYSGELTPIFRKKIILAAVLSGVGLICLLWRWLDPQLLIDGGPAAWVYLLLVGLLLACVTLLGHYGGMLVFNRNPERSSIDNNNEGLRVKR